VLAYVFWHAPASGVDAADYEEAMAAFHRALATHPPAGFHGGFTLVLAAPGWFAPAPEVYVDVYTVDDFAALEELNAGAVSGPRRSPHDAVARHAAAGAGGVLRLLRGAPAPLEHVSFLAKPADLSYDDFTAALAGAAPAGSGVWMRQMVLGPGPEFWVLSPAPADLPWPAHRGRARVAAQA
jgi:hypothetical protein